MTYRLAYNPLDTPVVVDAAGRTIGGQEHGLADDNSPEVKDATSDDRLVFVEVNRDNNNTRAVVALSDRAVEVERRRAALMGRGRGDLHRMARERGLSSEQTDGQLAAELALDPTVEVETPEEPTPAPTPDTPPAPRRTRAQRAEED